MNIIKRRNLVALIGAVVLATASVIAVDKLNHYNKILRDIGDFSSQEFREGIETLFSDFDVLKHVDFSDYNKLNKPETRTSTKPTTYSTETKPSRDY